MFDRFGGLLRVSSHFLTSSSLRSDAIAKSFQEIIEYGVVLFCSFCFCFAN